MLADCCTDTSLRIPYSILVQRDICIIVDRASLVMAVHERRRPRDLGAYRSAVIAELQVHTNVRGVCTSVVLLCFLLCSTY